MGHPISYNMCIDGVALIYRLLLVRVLYQSLTLLQMGRYYSTPMYLYVSKIVSILLSKLNHNTVVLLYYL